MFITISILLPFPVLPVSNKFQKYSQSEKKHFLTRVFEIFHFWTFLKMSIFENLNNFS